MQVGKQGELGFGLVGPTGPTGSDDGATGATGVSPVGETGPTGASGLNSTAAGDVGGTGPDGAGGTAGETGQPGDKECIVESPIGPIGLSCIEAPEVWFEDIQSYEVDKLCSVFPVDPIFLSLCTELHIAACVCNRAIRFACTLVADQVQIFHSEDKELKFNVTLRGKRIGFATRRFHRHTTASMLQNNLFWAQG